MTAVHAAHVGDTEEDSIRVTVGYAGCRAIFVFLEWVFNIIFIDIQLVDGRNALPEDGIVFIVCRIDQGQIIRRDAHGEFF